jgi:type II secretory pathway pseudopilin PulG
MIELLVVISIIVLLVAIAVPSFSSIMGSSERSLAENQFKAALAAARDAAIQSDTGDAAAVFIYTINSNGAGGRLTIVPCIAVGKLFNDCLDGDPDNDNPTNNAPSRDVFAPIATIEPMQLPRGWSVRAYAGPGMIYDGPGSEMWYESYGSGGGAGTTGQPGVSPQWVFPETAFYPPDSRAATDAKKGTFRQSFMVRFKAGTGALDTGAGETALVFDPVSGTQFRAQPPYSDFRADQLRIGGTGGTPGNIVPNAATWVRRILANRPEFVDPPGTTTGLKKLRRIIGDGSLDTILVRPVTELALYQEQRMAAAIGASDVNRATGTIYGDPAAGADETIPQMPTLDTSLFSTPGLSGADITARINKWIEGRYHLNNQDALPLMASDARVFTVDHYLGHVQELVP